MTILHLVNKSPYERNSFNTAVNHMNNNDTLLLIEDGVYAAVKGGTAAIKLENCCHVSVLEADIIARGITKDKLVDDIDIVNYAGFVDMVEANDKVQSWL